MLRILAPFRRLSRRSWLRTLKTGPRMLCSFTFAAVLLAGLGSFSLWEMQQLRRQALSMEQDWLPSIAIADSLAINLGKLRNQASVVLLKEDFGPAVRARPQRMCSTANRALEGDLFLEPSAMDMWAGL